MSIGATPWAAALAPPRVPEWSSGDVYRARQLVAGKPPAQGRALPRNQRLGDGRGAGCFLAGGGRSKRLRARRLGGGLEGLPLQADPHGRRIAVLHRSAYLSFPYQRERAELVEGADVVADVWKRLVHLFR